MREFKLIYFAFIGLSTICESLPTNSITILVLNKSEIDNADQLLSKIQLLPKTTNIFYESDRYIEYLENNLKGFIETTSLILSNIEDFIDEV